MNLFRGDNGTEEFLVGFLFESLPFRDTYRNIYLFLISHLGGGSRWDTDERR